MTLHVHETVEELLSQLAEYFIHTANEAIRSHGRFTVSLSGGSSPEKLYRLLASEAFRNRLDYSKVYFFFGDERYVPADSPDSNFRMVNNSLFQPLGIQGAQVFPVDTSLSPEAAAAAYMDAVRAFFNGAAPRFDLVLLGLGDNSHTASLFPHTSILQEKEAGVKAVFLEEQGIYRISFTAPLINLAQRVAFLVYGSAKAEAVRNILEEPGDPEKYPAQLINLSDGAIDWFLDKSAASKLYSAS
jgi:6-phosphogluconolactonase